MRPLQAVLAVLAVLAVQAVPAPLQALQAVPAVLQALQAVPAVQQFQLPDSVIANARARVENGWAPSVIIGVVDRTGTRYHAFGTATPDGGAAVNERTLYEIGSITKVFTSLALADMVVKREVTLDDPVRRYLPASVTLPEGDAITLRLLATHHSGLPRMPGNFRPSNPENPYADYDTTLLFSFLTSAALSRAPGAGYEYSNLGAGLLGVVLARRDGTSWEEMMRRRILEPLRLSSTMRTVTTEGRARLATGSSGGIAVSHWDLDALAGAGALRSSAEDMTRFLAAAMGLVRTPLDSVFRLAEQPLLNAGGEQMQIGLGWHVRQRPGSRTVWHNGGTGGFRSWAGYDRERGVGVVILTNSQEQLDALGFHALDHSVPIPPAPPRPMAIAADSLSAYEGNYALTPAFILTIRRNGAALMAQATGQQALRIYPSARDDFFYRAVPARIVFERDSTGRVIAANLHQNGRQIRGPRQ